MDTHHQLDAAKAQEAAVKAPDAQSAAVLQGVAEAQTARVQAAEEVAKTQEGTKVEAAPVTPPESAEATQPAASTTPSASEETQEPEEKGFMDKIKDYFAQEEAKGEPWYTAAISTLGFGFGKLWSKIKGVFGYPTDDEDEDTPEDSDENIDREEVFSDPAVPKDKGLLAAAKKQLDKLRADAEKKTYIDYAQEIERSDNPKYGRVPASTILAFARFESGFRPDARPLDKNGKPLSTAEGLGQFINKTWARFQAENPEFKDALRTDPKASLCAIAWYAKQNGNAVSVDATAVGSAGMLYEAHFAGAEGFRRIQAASRGETVDPKFIPAPYRGHKYPRFGITEPITTYAQYAQLANAFGAQVQDVATYYHDELRPDTGPLGPLNA